MGFNTLAGSCMLLNMLLKLAVIALLSIGSTTNMSMAQDNQPASVNIDFTQSQELDNWVIVNDTVMGGRSRTRLTIEDSMLSFSGVLSLENNGGFASIRRVYDPKIWEAQKQVKIQVQGDGREYQLRLRTNRRVDGVAYVLSFKTEENRAMEFTFNEQDFVPQFRGRLVSGAPALAFSDIAQVGLMLADKKPGEFTLLVERIWQ